MDAAELVFRNLLMNAVKHHDRETGEIWVSGETDPHAVSITVSDDGPGIPAIFAPKIFGVFQTLKARDELEATGMGLSLVQKTMASLKGGVTLVEGTARGAAFKLTWPEPTRPEEG